MSDDDRRKWNAIYETRPEAEAAPSELLLTSAKLLPETGRAVDLAGGTGRNTLWLARRGLDVTLVDLSDVGLDVASRLAREAGVPLRILDLDLEADPAPAGPWELIVCVDFFWRPLLSELGQFLAPGGLVLVSLATRMNLECHDRPSARFLMEPGELPGLFSDLEILRYDEGWRTNGRHEAWLVARRVRSGEDALDELAVDVSEAEVTPLETVGQTRVVDPQEMQ